MNNYKSDLIKGGLLMGVVLGITTTLSLTVSYLDTAMTILAVATFFFFPLTMGIKYKKTLADDIPFGFVNAYMYSFYMMFIGSVISAITYIVVVMTIGTEGLVEQEIATLMESGITPPQETINMISSMYGGNNWMYMPLIGAILSPAIYAVPSAFVLRKKEA